MHNIATTLLVLVFAALRSEPVAAADDAAILGCSREGVKVGMTYIRHPDAKKLEEAVGIFKSNRENVDYPAGTIIQLVPHEVMVKRTKAEFPNSNGWEFFILNVSGKTATVAARGDTASNPLGTCISCHGPAVKHDYVCAKGHGCGPIPVTDEQIAAIQNQDPRCPAH